MDDVVLRWVQELTGAARVRRTERVQSLWDGYGELCKIHLSGSARPSVVLKRVQPPAVGARADRSHRRKCRSYDVETAFYRSFAKRCDDTCRVPTLLGSRTGKSEWWLLLEDLDDAGFAERRRTPSAAELDLCLAWLAAFHARFLGVAPAGLWSTGTYWHLATRPDELANIRDPALRAAAPALDRALREARFQTLVHGDAKPANFCFAPRGRGVAAVDFQYVGGGCGMKDVAYLLHGEPGARSLDGYFATLRSALAPGVDGAALEREWRALYPSACADFERFLAGWR